MTLQELTGSEEEDAAGKGEHSKETKQAATWVTPYFQKKAFSEAWLAFFRMRLPDAVFRKVMTWFC